MGQLFPFEKEKLIVGVIWANEDFHRRAMEMLVAAFGEIDAESEEFSFSDDFSTYYDEELGGKGLRRIYSFRETVDPARQTEIKTLTNAMEAELSENGLRRVNLDPGFINRGRLMLATTKGAGFRVPLKDGIWTEVTMYFSKGDWQTLPWTYRDYASPRVRAFLTEVRRSYLAERAANEKENTKTREKTKEKCDV